MKKRFLLPLITIIIVGALVAGCYYMTTPVQGETEEVEFKVSEGEGARTIVKNLKKAGLIRNEYFALIYVKLNNTEKHPIVFKKGEYILDKSVSLKDIIGDLNDPTAAIDKDSIRIRFADAGTFEDVAQVIATKKNMDVNDVIAKLDDATFVTSMVNKYTIVTNDVFKEGIRHHLEGYLLGDTYDFRKDATVEEIAEKLISTLNDKMLEMYKKNNFTWTNYHDVITLASIVEHEGPGKGTSNYEKELQGVAQVFLNRMNVGMTLGSDVTTYYSAHKKIGTDTLYASDFKICDGYNTRGSCVKALPVGPISSCSIDSIEAVVKGLVTPLDEYKDYYYFVADKNTNIHFSKTDADQQKVIKDLKNKGLWLE